MKINYNKEDIQSLRLEYAYIQNQPITNSAQMIKQKILNVASVDDIVEDLVKEHLENAILDGANMAIGELLEKKLCSFEGEVLCYGLDDYAELILHEGQIWYGDIIYHEKMSMRECHSNSIQLHEENPECPIVVGYALSEHGFWYNHTWLLVKDDDGVFVLETTEPSELYYGVVLTDELLKDFKDIYRS